MVEKNRTTVIIVSIVIVVLLITGGIVTWALVSKNIRSSVDVTYTPTEISGIARAAYTVGNKTESMKTDDNKDFVEFSSEDNKIKTLKQKSEISLTEQNNFVVFKYSFENSGDKKFNANLVYNDVNKDDKNFKVEYKLNGEGEFIESNNHVYPTLVVNEKNGDVNGSAFLEVKVTVVNFAKDAMFSGTFSWTLTKVNEGE